MNKFLRNLLFIPLIWLFSYPTFAADNAVTLTVGSGVTMRTKDVGAGVQASVTLLGDTSGNFIFGAAGTSNANVLSVQGIASGTALPVSSTTLATAANQTIANSSLATIAANTGAAIPIGTNTIGAVGQLPYPIGATPITASATGTTAATAATLAKASSVTTYICGFSIRANANAAATDNSTVVGTITGTLNFTQWTAPSASGIGITEMIFNPCIPSSTTNTDIVVTSAAPGTGGVVSVATWGYRL